MKDELSKIHEAAELVKICKSEGVKIPKNDGKDYGNTQTGRRNLRKLIRDHREELKAQAKAEKAEAEENHLSLPSWVLPALIIAAIVLLVVFLWPRITGITPANAEPAANCPECEVCKDADCSVLQEDLDEANTSITNLTDQNKALKAEKSDLEVQLAEALVNNPSLDLPADFSGTVNTTDFVGGLPNWIDLRNSNRAPGDMSAFVIKLKADFPSLNVLRLGCDDTCVAAKFYATLTSDPVDLLPLLEIGFVDEEENPTDPEIRAYMTARGVKDYEQLAQNFFTVNLGSVKADDGAYILVVMQDDPTLNVNNGGFISLTADTDPFTRMLDGSIVKNPSFVLDDSPEE